MINKIKWKECHQKNLIPQLRMGKMLSVKISLYLEFSKLKFIIGKKQEFYDHLICGDPRKMGEYQEEESS